MKLEKERGFNNTSVVSGVDRFIQRWAEVITEGLGDSGVHRVLLTIPYTGLTQEERSWWVEQWQGLVYGQQRNPGPTSSGISLQSLSQSPSTVTYSKPTGELTVDVPLDRLRGVDEKLAGRLKRLDVSTVRDLLYLFPRRHLDYSNVVKISDLVPGEMCTVAGIVSEARNRKDGPDGKRTGTEAVISDDTGNIRVWWPGQGSLARTLKPNRRVAISGKAETHGSSIDFFSPVYELLEQGEKLLHTGRLVPVYPHAPGMDNRTFRHITWQALQEWLGGMEEPLPQEMLSRVNLMPIQDAIMQSHYPDGPEWSEIARRRLAFDELFTLQLAVLSSRRNRSVDVEGVPITANREVFQGFFGSLPFSLTRAQRKCIREILTDLQRGTPPMNRLLQGEVGSGKTVVALAAVLAVAAAGFQGAIMAPTEVLAEQHFQTISRLLSGLARPVEQDFLVTVHLESLERAVSVGLLTGSTRRTARRELTQMAAEGNLDILVGTQALIQSGVYMPSLALAVADEQRQPGVLQQSRLYNQGKWTPHILTILATQLPRTLSSTLYGDLDMSTLDELPAGRQKVATRWVSSEKRQFAYGFMRNQIDEGRQGLIICPMAEESATIKSRAATSEYKRLSEEVFPDLHVGLLHGKMRAKEKSNRLRQFKEGEIDILVSTANIMTGIDTTNASVAIIEEADAFQLSEIHKLRGRVGRNAHKSYCLLMSDSPSQDDREGLYALEQIPDGVRIAEVDLELRGLEDIFGARQIGLPIPRMAKLSDLNLLAMAREEAHQIFEQDPDLTAPEYATIVKRVQWPTTTTSIDKD